MYCDDFRSGGLGGGGGKFWALFSLPKAAERRTKDAISVFKKEYPNFRKDHQIGPTYIGTVESAFQMDGVDRPVDYATISSTNVLTGNVATVISKGVTLHRWFVDKARSQGFMDGNENRGRKTAGAVVAETFEGVDPRKWHKEACGKDRREILGDAMENLSIP
ncbi:hypothetical protein Forpe1208_v016278 [Fusarium oxysporum f. sp. rapae]|uniref:Uncharacterized protein n=1 Tax=Fusarium oxysporum f. sp. rapae TaxID=485398 RepID=A0A8J5TPC3_FUSOX|nr:hypothetical protein Forpe1208_v016278 [Fusarium oxysporum f. sp. rapae]